MKMDDVITSVSISSFSYKIGILALHTSWMAEKFKERNASKNVSEI